jgi:hypothetical protein
VDFRFNGDEVFLVPLPIIATKSPSRHLWMCNAVDGSLIVFCNSRTAAVIFLVPFVQDEFVWCRFSPLVPSSADVPAKTAKANIRQP